MSMFAFRRLREQEAAKAKAEAASFSMQPAEEPTKKVRQPRQPRAKNPRREREQWQS